MIEAPIPEDDGYRLAALHGLSLLDTPPEAEFDTIVQTGRLLFGVPTCLVTLVDRDRQWFKARTGLEAPETPRRISFCGHAVLKPGVFVIPDAREDERFHDNPLVTGPPFIRFYAGAPVALPSGYTIGTVCILGPEPRHDFGAEQQQQLAGLAGLALSAITVQALRREADRARMTAERYQTALLAAPSPMALADAEGRILFCNDAFSALCRLGGAEGETVNAALGIAADIWSPALMRESGAGRMVLSLTGPAQQLAVYRDIEGFILAAAS